MSMQEVQETMTDSGTVSTPGTAGARAENPAALANEKPVKIKSRDVNVFYGEAHALKHVDLDIRQHEVTSLIGPSGCGKSTYLRCINRMNDVIDGCRVEGSIEMDGEDVYDPKLDVVQLRARVGMVFQKPNPFPKSI